MGGEDLDAIAGRLRTIPEVIELAKRNLASGPWDYGAAGAGQEVTVLRNREGLDRLAILPRVLRDVSAIDVSTSVLGIDVALPILCSPVGSLTVFHPDGAKASAVAADAEGTIAFVGMLSSIHLQTVQDASGGRNVFQLYVSGDADWTDAVVGRALETGVQGICVTVDSPVHGRRDRLLTGGFDWRFEREGVPLLLEGLGRERSWQAKFTWEGLERLRARVDVPLAVKGIVNPDDARRAADLGIDAIYVSNHGGRELDHGRAAIDSLPAVVAAVAGDAQVLFDSGIRHGTDVFKALALGADAVLIGRLQCWGLAAAGAAGVRQVLAILRSELLATMAMCGASSLQEIEPAMVGPTIPH